MLLLCSRTHDPARRMAVCSPGVDVKRRFVRHTCHQDAALAAAAGPPLQGCSAVMMPVKARHRASLPSRQMAPPPRTAWCGCLHTRTQHTHMMLLQCAGFQRSQFCFHGDESFMTYTPESSRMLVARTFVVCSLCTLSGTICNVAIP